jgi:hypothetical protein
MRRRSQTRDDHDDATATGGAIGTAPTSRGLEEPRDVAEGIEPVDRAFAFLDLCGFTAFIATHGEHAAVDTLSRFRTLTRELTVRRGIRVGKWLGDGAHRPLRRPAPCAPRWRCPRERVDHRRRRLHRPAREPRGPALPDRAPERAALGRLPRVRAPAVDHRARNPQRDVAGHRSAPARPAARRGGRGRAPRADTDGLLDRRRTADVGGHCRRSLRT